MKNTPLQDQRGDHAVGKNLGTISFSLSRTRDIVTKNSKRDLPEKDKNQVVVVDILRARAMPPKEEGRNPFVKLHFGKGVRKTSVKQRTLTPSWLERFEFMALNGLKHLQLRVMDKSWGGTTSLLGTVDIDLHDMTYVHSTQGTAQSTLFTS